MFDKCAEELSGHNASKLHEKNSQEIQEILKHANNSLMEINTTGGDSIRKQVRRIQGLLCDLLWSDPDPRIRGWSDSDQGVLCAVGPHTVAAFSDKKIWTLSVKAHQGLLSLVPCKNLCYSGVNWNGYEQIFFSAWPDGFDAVYSYD